MKKHPQKNVIDFISYQLNKFFDAWNIYEKGIIYILWTLKMKKTIYKIRNMMKNKNDEDKIYFPEINLYTEI